MNKTCYPTLFLNSRLTFHFVIKSTLLHLPHNALSCQVQNDLAQKSITSYSKKSARTSLIWLLKPLYMNIIQARTNRRLYWGSCSSKSRGVCMRNETALHSTVLPGTRSRSKTCTRGLNGSKSTWLHKYFS